MAEWLATLAEWLPTLAEWLATPAEWLATPAEWLGWRLGSMLGAATRWGQPVVEPEEGVELAWPEEGVEPVVEHAMASCWQSWSPQELRSAAAGLA